MSTAAAPTRVRVNIPNRLAEHKSWAKAVDAVDTTERDGYALQGVWLDRGAAYDLDEGTLVVTVDRHHDLNRGKDRVRLVLWRVTAQAQDGMEVVGEWSKWGHVGKAMLTQVAKALSQRAVPVPKRPEWRLATSAPPRPNRRAERCHKCRQQVPELEGRVRSVRGAWLVEHVGRCPDRTNSFPGRCHHCGQHVGAYCGLLQEHEGKRRVAHAEECPPVQLNPPVSQPNRRPGPCAVCWQQVPAMRGVVVGPLGAQQPLHEPGCPPNPYNPHGVDTWQVREVDPRPGEGLDYPVGTVARVSTGAVVAGHGARELLDGDQSLIAVAVAVEPRHVSHDTYGRTRVERISMWRPATEDEASPVLRAELRLLVETGLLAQARPLVSLLPGAPVLGASAPTVEELADRSLWTLPRVWLPAGAGRPETTLLLDEETDTVWTLVHNSAKGDHWELSNFGGYIAYAHPLTPERAELICDLREHQTYNR